MNMNRRCQPIPRTEIDASCSVPLLSLLGGGLLWLLIGCIFALIASIKFHAPHFLANDAHWTYGRIHAAHLTALLYGFALPSALGVGLWLLCRLGRIRLAGPAVIFIGAVLWYLSVAVGVAGILCGDGDGYESFEMPRYVTATLFVSYLLIATCGVLTFHRRREDTLYPSQWFVLGSLFWFPWIFSTASALLFCHPARGVMQASIAWWFANNLSYIVLGSTGLASIFYFVPKLLGRPLHSTRLAIFAFWGLALFGSLGGVPDGAPLPAWMVSLSMVGTVLTAIPVLAVILNLYQTARNDTRALDTDTTLRFTYVALIFWLIANVQRIVGVLPDVSGLTNYTWYPVAQWELFHCGFFAFAIFGAIYFIVPLLLNGSDDLPVWSPRLIQWHFGTMLAGVLISYLALLVAGIGQGYFLGNPDYTFTQIMTGTLIPLRAGTTGDLLFIIGVIIFLLNFALLLRQCRHGRTEKAVAQRKERA
jgi:cytochrome c oxidase cbb3-type subunit 1